MRLYRRTLGSFIAVILLECLLSGVAISVVLGGMQDEDARRELKIEAANAYESFNAWKLALWKLVNDLPEDPELARLVALGFAPGEEGRRASIAFQRMLQRMLAGTGVDYCLVRPGEASAGPPIVVRVAEEGRKPAPPEPSLFDYGKGHPFIDMIASPTGLWFSGATRIGKAPLVDLFLLKAIDPEFVGQLGYNPRVRILVSAGDRAVSSLDTEPVRVSAFLAFLARSRPESSYALYERSPGFDGEAGSVVQGSGLFSSAQGTGTLYLSTILSLEEYRARLRAIDWSVVLVFFVVAAITLGLSLGLARSVVKPVRDLLGATMRLREGEAGVEVATSRIVELGELQAGFNEMARTLDADKAAIDHYISEIVGLKEYNERVINSIREGLAVVDDEGRIEKANASFLRLFGLRSEDEAEGRLLRDLSPEIFDGSVLAILRGEGEGEGSARSIAQRRRGGRTYEVKRSGGPVTPGDESRHIVIVEDVSERVGYEERMMQAEKLSSIGLLSAGIAHEVNNPLGSILSNVQNLIAEEEDADRAKILGIIEGETKRIARIVRELLAFASPHARAVGEEGKVSCSPNAVASEIATLVGYSLRGGASGGGSREGGSREGGSREGERMRIASTLDPSCPDAAMSADELKQVLLNLLKNALQAVGAEGEVTLATAREDGSVLISVEDSGPGIAPEILPRICDPFFTTRYDEDGMGLGLSVVYGIVTKRGGTLRAENREAGGARFSIRLPAAVASASAGAASDGAAAAGAAGGVE